MSGPYWGGGGGGVILGGGTTSAKRRETWEGSHLGAAIDGVGGSNQGGGGGVKKGEGLIAGVLNGGRFPCPLPPPSGIPQHGGGGAGCPVTWGGSSGSRPHPFLPPLPLPLLVLLLAVPAPRSQRLRLLPRWLRPTLRFPGCEDAVKNDAAVMNQRGDQEHPLPLFSGLSQSVTATPERPANGKAKKRREAGPKEWEAGPKRGRVAGQWAWPRRTGRGFEVWAWPARCGERNWAWSRRGRGQ